MTEKERAPLYYSDSITALLPIFYVAWADAVLGPAERRYIQQKITGLSFLSDEERRLVLSWTDPSVPPPQWVFHRWLEEIRLRAGDLSELEKRDLASLGLEIARRGTDRSHWAESREVLAALRDLEAAFGVDNPESRRVLSVGFEEAEGSSAAVAEALRADLDEPYGALRADLRRLFMDAAFRLEDRPVKEDYREWVLRRVMSIAEYGYGAYAFPKEYGGRGDVGSHMAVFEMLGYHDLSVAVKFGVQFGLFGGAVYGLGTQRHHRRYLEKISTGELLGCFAMTETGHGSNVRGLETTIHYEADTGSLLVHTPHPEAGKEYIGNALHGNMAVVFGQLIIGGKSRGVHAVLVPLRDDSGQLLPGIRIEDSGYKMGLNGVDNGRIWFDEVRVSADMLLDRFGRIDAEGRYQSLIESDGRRFFTMLSTLVAGRISVALASVSAAKVAMTIAVRYAMRRRQFGPDDQSPETLLLDYPTHRERLLPKLAGIYAYHYALQELALRYAGRHEEQDQEIETLAAGLKAMASSHATLTIQEAREACGGKGYLSENRIPALKADTDIFTTFEGDNTVLLQLVAKGLLSGFRKQFNDAGFFGIIRLVMSRIGTRITELNPIVIRKTDREHLLDPDFHENALSYREQRLLFSLAQRMRRYLSRHMPPYEAFLRCQLHMVELAKAHLERHVVAVFREKSSPRDVETEAERLRRLCYQLHAVDTLWNHRDWFLEKEYFSPAKAEAIRRLREKLLRDLRPHAGTLVDAFAIPQESLAAEILRAKSKP